MADKSVVLVDSTHVKARANCLKYEDAFVEEQDLWYKKELQEEINWERETHGKMPLKDKSEGSQDDKKTIPER